MPEITSMNLSFFWPYLSLIKLFEEFTVTYFTFDPFFEWWIILESEETDMKHVIKFCLLRHALEFFSLFSRWLEWQKKSCANERRRKKSLRLEDIIDDNDVKIIKASNFFAAHFFNSTWQNKVNRGGKQKKAHKMWNCSQGLWFLVKLA